MSHDDDFDVLYRQSRRGLEELRKTAYDREADLQELLAEYPKLLAGEQIDPGSPRRWLLIKREMRVPSNAQAQAAEWSVDHVFVDQDGILTLIEVKRGADPKVRREVIGQLLDYAASAVLHWTATSLEQAFGATCRDQALDAKEVLSQLVPEEDRRAQFWHLVRANLATGRIRLVVASDRVPEELRRVCEFLNEQMAPAEVLALEIKLYRGNGQNVYAPRIHGQTPHAQQTKQLRSQEGTWTEDQFVKRLNETRPSVTQVARDILDFARQQGLLLRWGQGAEMGQVMPVLEASGDLYYTFALRTDATVRIWFANMAVHKSVADKVFREKLGRDLQQIPGLLFEPDYLSKRPKIDLELLSTQDAMSRFQTAFKDYYEAIRSRLGSAPGEP